ncbi:MAG TPA: 30S ribosomal protein S8 [Verrucomicrobiae bacterium]|nr:30S ribosomal protein S8 [Verrucomicrobiae bacterium]
MLTDPIADMLTRIRNANLVNHERVEMPHSRMKAEVARVLRDEGYVRDFGVLGEGPIRRLWVELKPRTPEGRALSGLRRVSRPGLRVYTGRSRIPLVRGGLGTAIVSTSRGLMSGRAAHRLGLGGEIVALVW